MVEFQEYYYRPGYGYVVKPLLCNVAEIAAVKEDEGDYPDFEFRTIVMSNGKTYTVKDSYKDIRFSIDNVCKLLNKIKEVK